MTRVVIDPGVLVSAFISPKKAALAQAHCVDAVVSGDRHLLDAASSELSVLTPREMADRLGLASTD